MKSISNQAGLYRTENSYYYRKKVPHDLREIIGVRECKKALKSGDYIAAKQTTAFLNSSLDRLFDMIRVMQPTSDDIKFLIRNYFERLLMDAEGQLWLDSEVWRGWEKEDHDGATPDERIEQLQYGLTFVKEIAKQQGHHERFLELAKELMAWKGFTFNEMSPALPWNDGCGIGSPQDRTGCASWGNGECRYSTSPIQGLPEFYDRSGYRPSVRK